MVIYSILLPFGIFYGYLFRYGMLYQEKSGNRVYKCLADYCQTTTQKD
jgi:hypothetical protein